ncbi:MULTISPECIES: HNH endonuclease [Enterobacteriaceae]|nr:MULTISPECIES: HNH endonuclease [Enterobacteriaceae]TRL65472.1 hypothetical protein FMM65_18485 [Citrobacter youngae]HCJ2602095.1 HNH endonuclease [Escherichia coli]HED1374772.1 HNH endonuclease [Enterobacter hormaechei subsp. hoffmannii]ELC7775243.1 HNH endonuclease [Enterobacter hormaechei]MBA8031136.1 HNH endonuclease [Citrobacter freundii]
MAKLTNKYLKEILEYSPESGVFIWKVCRGTTKAGDIAGSIKVRGYLDIKINKKLYKAHRLAWFYMYGVWPANLIDHINGNRSDNRLCNLREATHKENCRNQRMYKNNKSGVKGVNWNKTGRKWLAACAVDGKRYHLGMFEDISEAEKTIKDFREKYHGEFAKHEVTGELKNA